VPTEIPTARPIDPADYQGWWTYIHPVYNFSIMLPEDWLADETTTFDPLMNGHWLMLHPEKEVEKLSIRMTFRRVGEDARLWPTGVGQAGHSAGTLDVEPASTTCCWCAPAGGHRSGITRRRDNPISRAAIWSSDSFSAQATTVIRVKAWAARSSAWER
jgi:hypothetical protein